MADLEPMIGGSDWVSEVMNRRRPPPGDDSEAA